MGNMPIFGDIESFLRIKGKFRSCDLFFNFGGDFVEVYKLQGLRKNKIHVEDLEPSSQAVEAWIDDRINKKY